MHVSALRIHCPCAPAAGWRLIHRRSEPRRAARNRHTQTSLVCPWPRRARSSSSYVYGPRGYDERLHLGRQRLVQVERLVDDVIARDDLEALRTSAQGKGHDAHPHESTRADVHGATLAHGRALASSSLIGRVARALTALKHRRRRTDHDGRTRGTSISARQPVMCRPTDSARFLMANCR